MQKYVQNEPRLNEVYYKDNLHDKIKDESYVINLNEYSDIGTHWIALYVLNDNVTYFDSFGVEHISKEIKKIIENKKAYGSIMSFFYIYMHERTRQFQQTLLLN